MNISKRLILFISFLLSIALAVAEETEEKQSLNLTILITNDLQSQVEPFEKTPTQTVGGYARLGTLIKEIRQDRSNVLLLNSGDSFLGTFFYHFKGIPEIAIMNMLFYDASCLGNHEFDLGPTVVARRIEQARFPFLCANIRINGPPALKEAPIRPMILKQFKGFSIGIIGLTTDEITVLSHTGGELKVFEPVSSTIQSLITDLKERADLVVVLTHIGASQDKILAEKLQGIDVICGGHSHDAYETIQTVTGSTGETTYIVQAGSHAEYLGQLDLSLTTSKTSSPIEKISWKLIPVSNSIVPDREIDHVIQTYISQLPLDTVIGKSTVDIDAREENVRRKEAAIGNLFADALKEKYATDIALMNGGGIRGNRIYEAGDLTTNLISEMHSFNNEVVLSTVTGQALKQALERSVCELPFEHGRFLQVSGITMVVNPKKTAQEVDIPTETIVRKGERVTAINVNGKPLDLQKSYRLATTDFLAQGGDGFFMVKESTEKLHTREKLTDVLIDFIRKHTPIAPQVDGRITIKDDA